MHLREWLKKQGLSDTEMAAKIHTKSTPCDRTLVSKYRRGVIRPSWPAIARIRKVTKAAVCANDFAELVRTS